MRWDADVSHSGHGKMNVDHFTEAMMSDFVPTQEYLRETFLYDPTTGRLLRKKKQRGNAPAGSPAGWLQPNGYIRMCVKGQHYQSHRLVWMYFHGAMPDGVIDHVNGIKSDNRIENLRDVTQAQNAQNSLTLRKNNTTGYVGVSKNKGKFQANIWVDGKSKYLGRFHSAKDAHEAYLAAKNLYHDGAILQ